MLLVAVWYGFHLGAMQAFARALFAPLIPYGKERYVGFKLLSRNAYLPISEPVALIFSGFDPLLSYCSVFYSAYELTNKGSSWLGPLTMTVVKELTGNLRYSFIFVFVSIVIPAYALGKLDFAKGKSMAESMGLSRTRLPEQEAQSKSAEANLEDSAASRPGISIEGAEAADFSVSANSVAPASSSSSSSSSFSSRPSATAAPAAHAW
jgi:hypothetical protein